ncbi:NAD(P)H-binding protein [Enterococcus sp. HY326]|uniref:NAD(P)H-binding protein n=1 Tax=Enterococcus sp. HY326 TaxID=2971265 RepID=UPI002240A278|nr:NAD(P)H-binding protein [Enterococcus sp. HY326]
MKVLILGAAGQIGRMVTKDLLEQTNAELVLYGRNVTQRLAQEATNRCQLVDGTFEEVDKIASLLSDVDAMYLNYATGDQIIAPLVKVLEPADLKKVIFANVPDLYQEVEGPFTEWYRKNTGIMWQSSYRKAADIIENSSLNYIILRITWLYNEEGNTKVHLTRKGEPFKEAQVTRQAVSQVITDLLTGKLAYNRESLGVGEPNTEWSKPSFY